MFKNKENENAEKLTFYYGDRHESFYNLIKSLLKKGNIKDHYISSLLTKEAMIEYEKAFTSNSITSYMNSSGKIETDINSKHNYEIYEKLGDGVFDCFIGFYPYRRFPDMTSVKDVKVLHIIRSNYGSKKQFSQIAENLGFWDFISSNIYQRNHQKKKLLEDVFEAFLGCTCNILDKEYKIGVGYAICYDILKTIFDDIELSTEFEVMQDYKSRLNEIFNQNKYLGRIKYVDTRDETFAYSIVYRETDRGMIEIGKGQASIKKDAQQQAAKNGLEFLEHMGIKL
jgi:dsRNA-specific ribonuclease